MPSNSLIGLDILENNCNVHAYLNIIWNFYFINSLETFSGIIPNILNQLEMYFNEIENK